MKVIVTQTPEELGKEAAILAAGILNAAIAANGKARLVLSTGASQFETIKALIQQDLAWEKVEMFHLDEYVGLPESHPASFRKYLKERFTSQVKLKKAVFVNGEGDVQANIVQLAQELTAEPIDLGIVGIGENGHIAFNDPPADFNTQVAYKVVKLDENCKKQQVREGWFPTLNDVPQEAITMSVSQIMRCKAIISAVPHQVKAAAIKATLERELTPEVPATMLKQHPNLVLLIDQASASLVSPEVLAKYQG
ncbi:MAG TPA: glucosamine-6-phosphate deaminase [Bacillota bacterium]|nr:glucosamine-6-phosphate deaminase [Bacillota bacterium]